MFVKQKQYSKGAKMLSKILGALKAHILFILVGGLIFTTGCEDNQVQGDEHTDADGFILESEDGTEVYREFEGTSDGVISLAVGDTLELFVHFLDHDGNEIEHAEHEEGEEEEELSLTGNDTSIAIVEHEEHEEGEEEHGDGFHVIGVSAGSTDFKLQLMHGDHADYTSTNNVPIVVN